MNGTSTRTKRIRTLVCILVFFFSKSNSELGLNDACATSVVFHSPFLFPFLNIYLKVILILLRTFEVKNQRSHSQWNGITTQKGANLGYELTTRFD